MLNGPDPDSDGTGPAVKRARRFPRTLVLGVAMISMALLLFNCSGCSPVYLAKAGWSELKILRGRRPFDEVINDRRTDHETRRQLLLARQARAFAIHMLELDAGDSYTSFTQLESDTLAWVLSAAYRDRLEPKTWWFPIVGRVPYKGYSSEGSARKAQADLVEEGMDTYLRTTSAFSTLGWFADPLLSSLLRYDDVDLVETILHELSHNHLFVPGKVRFNESFATFVGRTGAIRFFCGPDDALQDTEKCTLAQERWEQYQEFSGFLDEFIEELGEVYASTELSVEEKVQGRENLFAEFQERYGEGEAGSVSPLIRSFLGRPLNNAVLLARMRYYHRLKDFQTLLDQHQGDLPAAIRTLKESAQKVDDPFDLLPEGSDP
jgi:predicted aminopeptidase